MSTGKSKLDTGLVRELAAILRDADLGEVEVEHEGLRIRVSKPAAPVANYAAPQMVAAPASAPVVASPTGMTTETAPPAADTSATPANAVTRRPKTVSRMKRRQSKAGRSRSIDRCCPNRSKRKAEPRCECSRISCTRLQSASPPGE